MPYSCSSCDAQFQSAAGVTQHVALHHNTCAECDTRFDDTDSLRDHIHENH
jgi:DNA-directed RNA polymerase subunit RPC12/RpoP